MTNYTKLRQAYSIFAAGLWYKVDFTTEKANAVWDMFWSMLVSGGWSFNDDDIIKLQRLTMNSYVFHSPDEHHYSQAVRINNISFCRAYEKWRGRKPFIWKAVDYGCHWGHLPYGMHSTQDKTQGRLVIGASFVWEGISVRVTSFNDEKRSLVACAYEVTKEGEVCSKCHQCIECDHTKISRRFTITSECMAATRKALQKEREQEAENGD